MIIANVIFEYAGLNEIWFVISPQNPHKRNSRSLIHEFDRMDMVELAIVDHPQFRAVDIEFRMPKPNYTIDTLAYLQDKYPGHQFRLIIGEDNLESFTRWKNYKLILDQYGLLVYPRPNAKESKIKDHPNVKLIEAPRMDISASFIRKCIKEDKSVRYLVPEKVYQFIKDRKLYT